MSTAVPLFAKSDAGRSSPRPRPEPTLAIDPELDVVLVSAPSPLAIAQARAALEAGLHVFLAADDVSLTEEAELKRDAATRGLLVMGPYCGSALLDGVPLGFANRVPRGPVGIVGANGTAIQEVASLLAARGIGVSHAIGTGRRDLSLEVGGVTSLAAIDALGRDPSTDVILLVSKPAPKLVADRVLAAAQATGKPVIVCFLGSSIPAAPPSRPSQKPGDSSPPSTRRAIGQAPITPSTLEEGVLAAAAVLGVDASRKDTLVAEPIARAPWQRRLIGYFTGGSLAHEAIVVLSARCDISTNLGDDVGLPADSGGHTILDLGDAEFTQGRAHPVTDPSLRNELVEQIADDPAALVLLMDVVLGRGAHADPAGALVPSLRIAKAGVEARGGTLHVIASVVGTDGDPQVRSNQIATLEREGVIVAPSNAAAARAALGIVAPRTSLVPEIILPTGSES
jgi:FdrA protein